MAGQQDTPFGVCNAESLFVPAAWADNGSEYADYGVINLEDACDTVGFQTGFFGLFSVPGRGALTDVPVATSGTPTTSPSTPSGGRAGHTLSQRKMVFYRLDTYFGQAGSPLFQNRPGCGPCVMGIDAVFAHFPEGGPHFNNNHGPRITGPRLNLILDVADDNGG